MYKTNKIMEKYLKKISKMWAWQFCGPGNIGQQTCAAPFSLESVC